MPMLAEVVDAVVGGDTHRDTHALEMLAPTGVTIATLAIDNDDDGFEEAISWIAARAPGPRIVIGLEGTRSYGVGLPRAVRTAGLTVVEVERPRRADRRRGTSDPIDAHLAGLQVLRMAADRLPTPRADGPREALRILLGARRELTVTPIEQLNRLRALLLGGDDSERTLSRAALTDSRLTTLSRRRGHTGDGVEQAVRRQEARRFATAIRAAGAELAANRQQLLELVTQLAPALLALSSGARAGVRSAGVPGDQTRLIAADGMALLVGNTDVVPHPPLSAVGRQAASILHVRNAAGQPLTMRSLPGNRAMALLPPLLRDLQVGARRSDRRGAACTGVVASDGPAGRPASARWTRSRAAGRRVMSADGSRRSSLGYSLIAGLLHPAIAATSGVTAYGGDTPRTSDPGRAPAVLAREQR